MRRLGLGAALIAVPLSLALVGPWFVPQSHGRHAPFMPHGLLGTDFVGRDAWHQVLAGGRTVVLVALAATVCAYAVGVPWGMVAATTRVRLLDEALMRPLDLLLAVPSLLVLILLATLTGPGIATLTGIVALITFPDVARLSRAAAMEIAGRHALEAMRLQGESWWRRSIVYIGRSMLRTLVADIGVRLTASLYLVASASFLGVGVPPDAADWAVMVDRNRGGLFLQPWAVVVPALLIVALSVGLNLMFDKAMRRRA